MEVPRGTKLIVHTLIGYDFYKVSRSKVVRYKAGNWVRTEYTSLSECGMYKECIWW